MNANNVPPTPPEAPPTGPVLSAEEIEKLQKAARRLIAVQNEVLAMPQEQREWFFSKEGHSDAFDLAWWVNVNLAQLRAALSQRDARIAELERDREKLDWLEKSHFDLIYTTTLKLPRWCVGAEEAYFEEEGSTVRAAIDAAMKEPK